MRHTLCHEVLQIHSQIARHYIFLYIPPPPTPTPWCKDTSGHTADGIDLFKNTH